MTTENKPLVSVIIPMYNAAQFIPQTLESLLGQTMKDFEVVVIDDCSTDNSVAVVDSFKEKFRKWGGVTLNVIKMPKNAGMPGVPRNVGIQFSHGKYVCFLDSDDLYTKTALEELSTLAEKFQVDMIHNDSRFKLWQGNSVAIDDPRFTDMNELTDPKNFKSYTSRKRPLAVKPELEQFDIKERVERFVEWEYFWGIPTYFLKRDFLVANQIFFPPTSSSEDFYFKFNCVCHAERILRVPKAFYIIRPRGNSVSRTQLTADEILRKWIKVFRTGFNEIERITDGIKFFKDNPYYRYIVMAFQYDLTSEYDNGSMFVYRDNRPYELHSLIKKEFAADAENFAAYLFNTVNAQRLQIMELQADMKKVQPSDAENFAAYLFNTVNSQQLQIMQLRAELRKFQQQ